MTNREKIKNILETQRKAILDIRNDVVNISNGKIHENILEDLDTNLSILVVTNTAVAEVLEITNLESFDEIICKHKEISFLENLYKNSSGED